MKTLFFIIIIAILSPLYLKSQELDSFKYSKDYELFLQHQFDSINHELNDFYNTFIKYDSLNYLRDSQIAWLKFRDTNIKLVESKKKISYSNSKQIELQVLILMTQQRLGELIVIFQKQLKYPNPQFSTAGIAKEQLFIEDILNQLPKIKFNEKVNYNYSNIDYKISDNLTLINGFKTGKYYQIDLNKVPISTLNFINYLIEKDFFSVKGKPDYMWNATRENYKQLVKFDLVFEPLLFRNNLFNDIWKLSLCASGIDGGKPYFFTSTKFIDKDGTIIELPKDLDGNPCDFYYENNVLFIKFFICKDENCENGEIVNRLYDKNKHRIE